MSWPERRRRATRLIAALVGLAALAGCGFRPLYAPPDPAAFNADLASIKVNPISDRIGQILAIDLRDGFNPTGEPVKQRYALSVSLAVTRRDLGVQITGTASRSVVDISANFSLLDLKSNTVVYTGIARADSAFNVLADDYATLVAENDAEHRILGDLTDDIRNRIAYFLQYRPPRPATPRDT